MMIVRSAVLAWVALAVALHGATPPTVRADERSRPAVLVELFTSQGCSSCPPADRLLTELGAEGSGGAKVIPLSFHVDYWNYIGWTDPFSAAEWSARQRAYAAAFASDRVYTPQVVVDGRADCVGSDRRDVSRLIAAAAARDPAARLELEQTPGGGAVVVSAFLDRGAEEAELLLATFETGLETRVGSGENARRTLRNDYVVRRLQSLGRIAPGEALRLEHELSLDPSWRRDRLGVAVFLQAVEGLEIYGARELRF